MGRDEALEDEEKELAARHRHTPGTFSREMFDRMKPAPNSPMSYKSLRACLGYEPEASKAWATIWLAHNRHPTWVARALRMLTLSGKWADHLSAQTTLDGLDKVSKFRNSRLKEWLPLALE